MKEDQDSAKPEFSIGSYDKDGDLYEDGIYLHFGDTRILVAKNELGFERFISHLNDMRHEIDKSL